MKKIISCIVTLVLIVTTVFVLPLTSQAASIEVGTDAPNETFKKASYNLSQWTKHNDDTIDATVDTSATDRYYSGGGDAVSDLKVSYTTMTSANSSKTSFYYNSNITIEQSDGYRDKAVLSFWVYSSQAISINMFYNSRPTDSTTGSVNTSTLTVSIPEGESFVSIPLTLFEGTKGQHYGRIYQWQFRPYGGTGATGELYIDNLGFYREVVTGDFDGDTDVDLKDLFLLKKISVNGAEDGTDTSAYNLYQDNFINHRDVTAVRNYMLGLNDRVSVVTPTLRTDTTFTPVDVWGDGDWSTSISTTAFEVQEKSGYYYAGDNDETALKADYIGSGKSLKVTYDTSIKSGTNLPQLRLDKHNTPITAMGDGLALWLKSETEGAKIRVVVYDNSDTQIAYFATITMGTTGGFYYIPYTELKANAADNNISFDSATKKITYIDFRTVNAEEQNTFYFDSFCFYEGDYVTKDEYMLYNFDEVTDVANAEWKSRFNVDGMMSVALETGSDNVHSASAAANKLVLSKHIVPSYGSQSGIAAYIYADQPTQVTVLWNWAKEGDSNYLSSNKTISLEEGENFVVLPMYEQIHSSRTEIPENFEFYNLQFRLAMGNANCSNHGTVYVDSIGIVDIDSNRDASFIELSEYKTATNWGSNGYTSALTVDNNAEQYYGPDGDHTAVKVDYDTSIEDGNKTYANAYLKGPFSPDYNENTTITAVIYVSESMHLSAFWAWDSADGGSGNSSNYDVDLSAGENIIKIPMGSYVFTSETRYAGSTYDFNTLQLRFSQMTSATGTIYIDSVGILQKPSAIYMLDENNDTYWGVGDTKTNSVELELKNSKSFNSIEFTEHNNFITDYKVEAKLDGADTYTEIYRQDEMGNRVAILDKTYTAQYFKVTATSTSVESGIAEIKFQNREAISGTSGFKNVSFYSPENVSLMESTSYSELKGLTDVILINYGNWDKSGNFNWITDGEETFQTALTTIKGKLAEWNQTTNIWFSLGNYKDSTVIADATGTAKLLSNTTARDKLANFAADLCHTNSLYGIDIDYEYPIGQTAWNNFNSFITNLDSKLAAKGDYKLSCDLTDNHCHYISSKAISAIDVVNVMAYDRPTKDVNDRGRHSTYAIAQDAIEYFTNLGFNKSKLVLGLPYYGKAIVGGGNVPKYNSFVNNSATNVTVRTNIVTHNGNEYYFNGVDMIRDKVYYAMNNGCAGVFNWRMGCDVDSSNSLSLSNTVNTTITQFKSK